MEFTAKLTIKLHSGRGLKDAKHLSIMSPYATIYITKADGTAGIRHKSNIAVEGDSNPEWEYPLVFKNVSMNKNYNLVIKIKHYGRKSGIDRKIGKVEVPFRDLLEGDYSGNRIPYQVMTKAGETQGLIYLSHSFTDVVLISGNEDGANTSNVIAEDDPSKKGKRMKRWVNKVATNFTVSTAASVAAQMIGQEFDMF